MKINSYLFSNNLEDGCIEVVSNADELLYRKLNLTTKYQNPKITYISKQVKDIKGEHFALVRKLEEGK